MPDWSSGMFIRKFFCVTLPFLLDFMWAQIFVGFVKSNGPQWVSDVKSMREATWFWIWLILLWDCEVFVTDCDSSMNNWWVARGCSMSLGSTGSDLLGVVFFPAVMHVAIDISVTTIASKCGFVWKRNVYTNRNHNTLWKEPTSPRWSWLHLWIWFTLRRRNSTAVIDQHVPHFSMVSPIPNPCWTQGHAKLVEESSSGEEPPWCGDAQVMPGYATSFGIAAYHWQPKNYKIDHHEVLWISPVKSRNNFYPWGVLALADCSWAMVRAWNSGTNLRIQTGFFLLTK